MLVESREFVYDEYLDSISEDIHYTTVNGVKSCVSGLQVSLLELY